MKTQAYTPHESYLKRVAIERNLREVKANLRSVREIEETKTPTFFKDSDFFKPTGKLIDIYA